CCRHNNWTNSRECFYLSWNSISGWNDNSICSVKIKIKRMVRKEIYSKDQPDNSYSFAFYYSSYVLVKRRIHSSTSVGCFKNCTSTCDLFCDNVFCFILYG